MPKYQYVARSRSGELVKGELTSPSKNRAKNTLASRNLKPLKVIATVDNNTEGMRKGINRYIYRDKSGTIQISLGESLPTTKELALFSKQFALMIENGIPILQALKLLKEQQRKLAFEEIIGKVHDSIEQGSSLSDALEPYPRVFDSLYVAMTQAGEASGRLDIIMNQLVMYIEKAAKLKSQVKAAMTYPTIIVVVAIAVVTLLLVFVVPSFAQQFAESGNELPELTQMILDLSDWLVSSWHKVVLFAVAVFFGFRYWYNTDKGRVTFDEYILKAPVLGDVMTKIAIGRFCSTMSTMLSSGVSILEALEICAASSGNAKIEEFILHVKNEISRGQNFSEPLMESDLFPKMVSSMVAVGENTGTLDETLAKVTEIYEDEVDTAIAAMMAMIEPAMIVVIGGIVGFILIAMYLPIFDMAGNVGG